MKGGDRMSVQESVVDVHHDFVMDLFDDGLVPAMVMHDSAVKDPGGV